MMNVLLGVSVMVVCLVVQALLLLLVLRFYLPRSERIDGTRFLAGMAVICGVMVLLVLGNVAQAAVWAVLFMLLGEFDGLAEAFYHSVVNFATLGYGDIVMSETYRVLGPLEAMNGVLMIGVSTAVLMFALQDVLRRRRSDGRDA
ncbi:MAG: ion channel [Pseudomonadales bacterium]|jgi:hypothetical protein